MSIEEKLKKLRILVIDDDEFIRLTIKTILKKYGCTIFEASDGNMGVALFKSEKPNIVITDILMPDKEGIETISEIRATNATIKIIAISGGGSTHNMAFLQLAKKVGANHILSKPIRPDELMAAIKA